MFELKILLLSMTFSNRKFLSILDCIEFYSVEIHNKITKKTMIK